MSTFLFHLKPILVAINSEHRILLFGCDTPRRLLHPLSIILLVCSSLPSLLPLSVPALLQPSVSVSTSLAALHSHAFKKPGLERALPPTPVSFHLTELTAADSVAASRLAFGTIGFEPRRARASRWLTYAHHFAVTRCRAGHALCHAHVGRPNAQPRAAHIAKRGRVIIVTVAAVRYSLRHTQASRRRARVVHAAGARRSAEHTSTPIHRCTGPSEAHASSLAIIAICTRRTVERDGTATASVRTACARIVAVVCSQAGHVRTLVQHTGTRLCVQALSIGTNTFKRVANGVTADRAVGAHVREAGAAHGKVVQRPRSKGDACLVDVEPRAWRLCCCGKTRRMRLRHGRRAIQPSQACPGHAAVEAVRKTEDHAARAGTDPVLEAKGACAARIHVVGCDGPAAVAGEDQCLASNRTGACCYSTCCGCETCWQPTGKGRHHKRLQARRQLAAAA